MNDIYILNNLNTDEQNECKIEEYEKIIKTTPNIFKLHNKQQIIMNNYKETNILNKDLILNNIYSTDDEIYSQIYRQIDNPYQKRLNIILLLLKSDIPIPLIDMTEIIRFFNWLSPLNNEFNLSSKNWSFKTIKYGNKEKFLLQNSISKKDMGKTFYSNYIDLIKKKLTDSKVIYFYFEFKSKRFNKVKDIIWAFDKCR
jgi:hypothetical protein